ncbi:MAG TPA: hypothetical protein V6C90_27485 [Coleofasciculaceae cyanobacterium]|jgi:hypothetical protein
MTDAKTQGKFYPLKHFGKADLGKLALAQAACLEFEMTVTFEEMQ